MQSATSSSINLNTGPSGRAIAQPMDKDLLEALYQHTSLERDSSAQYLAMSLWLLERELRGFSNFFKKESLSEQEHGFNFAKYIIARGQSVELDAVTKPIQNWNSVEELVTLSFQMEADVTTSVQQLYSMAERSNDTRTTVFLDPVIDEQIKSEDEMAYLLGKVKFAKNDPSALFIIDNELNID
uniref:Ferritin n=1 Tax=Prochlorococcus marinus XMU1408 TaxID=2213228 RepID=A0A318RI76_PROMR|nr:ferritin [Prochlorococcus marinus]MBW3041809.1 ferritin [Prochlorococcus marinus str. XMU1408]PYE03283.1 ferritin [Prochlorococcus marinus XMU1408]